MGEAKRRRRAHVAGVEDVVRIAQAAGMTKTQGGVIEVSLWTPDSVLASLEGLLDIMAGQSREARIFRAIFRACEETMPPCLVCGEAVPSMPDGPAAFVSIIGKDVGDGGFLAGVLCDRHGGMPEPERTKAVQETVCQMFGPGMRALDPGNVMEEGGSA